MSEVAGRTGRRPRVTNQQIEEKLIEGKGNIGAVARACGVSRQAIGQRIASSPKLKTLTEELRETKLDTAEDKLGEAIDKGEGWAICFFLKTQGKKRGYVERSEITGADGGAIEVSTFEKSVLKSYGESDEQAVSEAG